MNNNRNNFNRNIPNHHNNKSLINKIFLGSGSYGVVFLSGDGKFVKKITLSNYQDQENLDNLIEIKDTLLNKYGKNIYKYFILPFEVDRVVQYDDLKNIIKSTNNNERNLILQKVRHIFYKTLDPQINESTQLLTQIYNNLIQKTNVNKSLNELNDFIKKYYIKKDYINKDYINKDYMKTILNNKNKLNDVFLQIQNNIINGLRANVVNQNFMIEYSYYFPDSIELFNARNFDNPKFIIKMLIDEVKMLHDNLILHNDIKPENIILSKDKPDKYYPRLVDFGLSVKLDKCDYLADWFLQGSFQIYPNKRNPRYFRLTKIIQKYYKFPFENSINTYNDNLLQLWKNNKSNRVNDPIITKLLLYSDVFNIVMSCFFVAIASQPNQPNQLSPEFIQFLNLCCGSSTTDIIDIDFVKEEFKKVKNLYV